MNEAIVDLQTRLAFQDGVLEQLNQVVTDQQQQLDKMQHSIEVLRAQLQSLQSTQTMQEASEPPPHY